MRTHTCTSLLAALRKLPSNQYRFQRGSGGEATGGGPRRGGGDDEGDDLRAYALRYFFFLSICEGLCLLGLCLVCCANTNSYIQTHAHSTDSRLGHRYVLAEGASGEEEAEEELVKDLPSLSLVSSKIKHETCVWLRKQRNRNSFTHTHTHSNRTS